MSRSKTNHTYCADFETTSESQFKRDSFTKVYLWKIMGVDTPLDEIGLELDDFIKLLGERLEFGDVVYFHNLSFDGEFILWYLLQHEYTYDDKFGKDHTFSSIIDETGSIYMITIMVNQKKIEFRCSYKLFPKSIKEIGGG